eukprot:GGOE01019456.1.p1 GENE.GGOE01019456.1~~GGOE01019456.1.p1  ORF type:complete len:170 (+),score=23.59 GGOE01019456.1:35-544(+)
MVDVFAGCNEVGKHAVWSVSSAKQGNGVQQLRDDNVETFWQSDGAQPHLIDIQFHKVMRISEVAMYLDYTTDESYTPKKYSIRFGYSHHDLREYHSQELDEPKGWIRIPLKDADAQDYICCNLMQIAIQENHQNGRDTHVRQVKVFAPWPTNPEGEYSTVEFSQWATIR